MNYVIENCEGCRIVYVDENNAFNANSNINDNKSDNYGNNVVHTSVQ